MLKRVFVSLAIFFTLIGLWHPVSAAQAADINILDEALPVRYWCSPSNTHGDSAPMTLRMPQGTLSVRPELASFLQTVGGKCEVWFGMNTLFRVSSPDAAVSITAGDREYAPTNYLSKTDGRMSITIKPGQNVSRLIVQMQSIFSDIDPRIGYTSWGPEVRERYFPETQRFVELIFWDYWQTHGGLAINGYPLTQAGWERLPDGNMYVVQYFERVRMEYHPENPSNLRILLGQFGRTIHPAEPAVPSLKDDSYHYFGQTGHNVPEVFWKYWVSNGGLEQFGYPITEPKRELLENGMVYTVQYFERARLEWHREYNNPNDVLLGQFGRTILSSLTEARIAGSR